jgi:isoleucyl-tRNA synthetase
MFERVPSKVSFPELELRLLDLWRTERIFERSVEEAKDKKPFVFYEGPPTANGMPHPGHVLTRVMKDVFLRHRAMTGHYVPRRGGWDTHGLPVEVEVEKELGIQRPRRHREPTASRPSRTAASSRCSATSTSGEKMTERIGFWVDARRGLRHLPQAYVESVWWALQTLFEKGLLYQDTRWSGGGRRAAPRCSARGRPGLQDRRRPVGVRAIPAGEGASTSFLAWTTTPWTLPSSNVALAASARGSTTRPSRPRERTSVSASSSPRRWSTSSSASCRTTSSRRQVGRRALVGTELRAAVRHLRAFAARHGRLRTVIAAEFVTLDTARASCTSAPAFGEDDFNAHAKSENGIGFLLLVKPDGTVHRAS